MIWSRVDGKSSASRAIGAYRVKGLEMGAAKDDYYWLLVDNDGARTRYAVCSLSVLASRADGKATDALAARLEEDIRRARFLD